MGLYRDMQAAGLHADAYTLTALMTACERVGKWDTGARLLSQLQADGVAPNIHHHNCLLNAYGRAGSWEQVHQCRCGPKVCRAYRASRTAPYGMPAKL